MTIASLIIEIAANTATLNKGVTEIQGQLDKVGSIATKMAGALGIAFSVQAVVNFGKAILADAGSLQKMSDITGITVTGLERLRQAGASSGNTIDEITAAIVQMENRLGSGDRSALAALDRLHLNLTDLMAMKPDQQFMTIANAIGELPDPTNQITTAIDIMGKSAAKVLPTMKQGFEDAGDAVVDSSKRANDALDKLGDAIGGNWQKAWDGAKRVLGEVVAVFQDPVFMSGATTKVEYAAAVTKAWDASLRATTATIPRLKGAYMEMLPPVTAGTKELNDGLADQKKKVDDAAAAVKKAHDVYTKWLESVTDATIAMNLSTFALHRFGMELPNVQSSLEGVDTVIHDITDTALPQFDINLRTVGHTASTTFGDIRTAAQKMRDDVGAVLDSIPQTLMRAFEGGGNLMGAFKSIGVQLADAIVTPIMEKLSKASRGAISVGASVAGGVGGAVGGSGASMVGGLAGMAGGAAVAGSIGATAAATTAGMLAIGVATAGIGLAAVGAYMAIRHFLNDTEKKINPLRQAFVDAAGGLEALNVAAARSGMTLHALLDSKNPKDYQKAIEELSKAFEFQNASMQFLNETVQKYGFSIEQLGPAMQKQGLDEQAQLLFKEFSALNAAGVDQVAVTQRMSEAVSGYLQQSIAMGIEVPASMRPMLQRFAEMGDLIDANGNAITDLDATGVTWSMSMTYAVKAIADEVAKLVAAIERGLNPAIAGIPDRTFMVRGVFEAPEIPDMAGFPGFAGGTHGQFLDFKQGTPVVLHGRERVSLPGEDRSSGGMDSSANGAKLDTLIRLFTEFPRNVAIQSAGAAAIARAR